jgi:hypothetical protein
MKFPGVCNIAKLIAEWQRWVNLCCAAFLHRGCSTLQSGLPGGSVLRIALAPPVERGIFVRDRNACALDLEPGLSERTTSRPMLAALVRAATSIAARSLAGGLANNRSAMYSEPPPKEYVCNGGDMNECLCASHSPAFIGRSKVYP